MRVPFDLYTCVAIDRLFIDYVNVHTIFSLSILSLLSVLSTDFHPFSLLMCVA